MMNAIASHQRLDRTARRRPQHGLTMLVVLVLLTVMLLGAVAMARLTEVGTLASGNASYRDASLQASEVGVNSAYAAVIALASEDSDFGTWYYARTQAATADGLPNVNWDTAPAITVGNLTVKYVAERMCNTNTPTEPLQQCLVRQVPDISSRNADSPELEPLNARQFRITVRVEGPRDSLTWVQSLMTKG